MGVGRGDDSSCGENEGRKGRIPGGEAAGKNRGYEREESREGNETRRKSEREKRNDERRWGPKKKEETVQAKITGRVKKDDRRGEDARGETKRSERDEGEIGLLGLGIGAAPAIRGLFHPYLPRR